ncbi:MAG: nuclear transport factor 2 family protein [Solirubrobacteraceae bacterium]
MTETNVQLARRGHAAVLRGDIDAVRQFLDPDVTWHGGDPTDAGACHNRDEALAFMRRAQSRRPLGELVDVIDAGDKVVVIMRPAADGGGPADLTPISRRFATERRSRWCTTPIRRRPSRRPACPRLRALAAAGVSSA